LIIEESHVNYMHNIFIAI